MTELTRALKLLEYALDHLDSVREKTSTLTEHQMAYFGVESVAKEVVRLYSMPDAVNDFEASLKTDGYRVVRTEE